MKKSLFCKKEGGRGMALPAPLSLCPMWIAADIDESFPNNQFEY